MSIDHTDQQDVLPDFRAGAELLEALAETGVLTESRVRIIESVEAIFESSPLRTPDVYEIQGIKISWRVFKTVYTDFDAYPTEDDVMNALGIGGLNFGQESSKKRALQRMVQHFRTQNPEAADLSNPNTRDRKEAYSEKYRKAQEMQYGDEWQPAPTRADIYPGKRNRTNQSTRIADQINSQEILSGQFYSDFTRIPPSQWGNWLRFWDKEKTSVQQDKRLFGRSWKKTFVLGYQLETNLVYEIWYNSIDSSFAVYDVRGNQMTRRFPTLSESVKALTNAIVQASSQDKDVLTGGMNNQIATSLLRSMAGSLDSHIEDLRRLDDKEQAEQVRKRQEAEEKFAKDRAEREKNQAEVRRSREEALSRIKTQLKAEVSDASARVFRDVGNVGMMAIDRAAAQLRRGAISFEAYAKTVVDSLELTPAEQEILNKYKKGEISFEEYMEQVKILVNKRKADQMKAENKKKADDLAKQREKSSAASAAASRQAKKANKPKQSSTKQPTKPSTPVGDYASRKKPGTGVAVVPTFESLLDNMTAYENQEEAVDDVVDAGDYMNTIRGLRTDAQKGSFTQNALKSAINSDLITVYTETRVEQNFPRTILPQWINRGRREPIVLPTDKPSLFNRAKMLIKGIRYQADFIVGFSLSDRVNIEVWYVTEPNPEHALVKFGATDDFAAKPTISSFYVFDVTSGKLLRKYVPYYRNAVQISMAKLSAQ